MLEQKEGNTFPDLFIRYKDSNGVESERKITEVEVREEYIVGVCQLRQENRTFKISRISSVIDLTTGEEIEDIYAFFDVPRPASNPLPPSNPLPLTTEETKRLRKKEKWELYRDYRFDIIRDHITKKFFSMFDNRCYKGERHRGRVSKLQNWKELISNTVYDPLEADQAMPVGGVPSILCGPRKRLNLTHLLLQCFFRGLQIIACLQIHPVIWRLSECLAEKQCQLGSYRASALDDMGNSHGRNAYGLSKRVLRNAKFIEYFFQEYSGV